METISEAAQKRARKIAWRISLPIASLLLAGALAFLAWNAYFRVEAGISATSGQLSHFLKVGDTFQLKTQLLSLASSGMIDHFLLKEPTGIVVAGDGSTETPNENLMMPGDSGISIRVIDGSLQLVRAFEISTPPRASSVLVVSKKVHLEIFLLVLAIQLGVFLFVNWMLRRFILSFANDLTSPIAVLASSITSANGYEELESNQTLRNNLRYSELDKMLEAFLKLLSRLSTEEKLRRKAERNAALSEVASQVAHDIRSPLAAFNMLIRCAKGIPENERFIFRSATQRINDIANSLIAKSKAIKEEEATDRAISGKSESKLVMLTALVDSVVSEKRVQYREKMNIQIETDFSQAYGLFTSIAPVEVGRVISNLINNSVEAIAEKSGTVTVGITGKNNSVRLWIEDNGGGIPAEIRDRLGFEKISFGKDDLESGLGLGLFHARKTAENYGGELLIESEFDQGTKVSLLFQKSLPPSWFVSALVIHPNTTVVTVDDDQTIHQIWDECFKEIQGRVPFTHIAHSSVESLESWLSNKVPENTIFLVDYEFLKHPTTGLDAIERLKIAKDAILVSSRCEDAAVEKRAAELGVKMIPKSLAGLVPIQVAPLAISLTGDLALGI